MLLLTILLFLTAVPDQSVGQEEDEEEEEEEDDYKITGSGIDPEVQKKIVNQHNEIRRNVNPTAANMLKMVWNETVGESARKWAEQCQGMTSPEKDRTFDHVLCGQSMFQSNQLFTWKGVIDYWKNKSRNFKYGVGAVDPKIQVYGYTQMIWYRTHTVGCGISDCSLDEKNKKYIFVCQYCPTGNIVEQIPTPYKEGPPCADCPKRCENKLCTNPCKYMDKISNCGELKKQMGCRGANKLDQCWATCKCKNKIK